TANNTSKQMNYSNIATLVCVAAITLFSTTLRSAEADRKAQVAGAPIKAEAEVVKTEAEVKAKAEASTAEIVRRLQRNGDGWVLNERDREKLSITLTNQQGKVCAGPAVGKVAPYGLLLEHEYGEFWCGWADLPPETREKYQ